MPGRRLPSRRGEELGELVPELGGHELSSLAFGRKLGAGLGARSADSA